MRTEPGRTRGFTLVELMLVVAIIGLLTSLAIPGFLGMQIRARKTERTLIEQNIVHSVESQFARDEKFPTAFAGVTSLSAAFNPPGTPVAHKRDWDRTVAGWNLVDFEPDGALYYQYQVSGSSSGGVSTFQVVSKGDLDGDSVPRIHTLNYELRGSLWTLISETDAPNSTE